MPSYVNSEPGTAPWPGLDMRCTAGRESYSGDIRYHLLAYYAYRIGYIERMASRGRHQDEVSRPGTEPVPAIRLWPSRRAVLRGGARRCSCLAGGGGCSGGLVSPGPGPGAQPAVAGAQATRSYVFNQGWLFGGRHADGAESPDYDDSGFAKVTLPHTVTPLSWGNWDHRSWEGTWIYRKHFSMPGPPRRPGIRRLRRRHGERDGGAEWRRARHPPGRLSTLVERADQASRRR